MLVRGRVLRDRGISPSTPDDSRWTNLRNTWRRLASAEVPYAQVEVQFRRSAAEVVADDEGHFQAVLSVEDPPTGDQLWYPAELRLQRPRAEQPVVERTLVMVPKAHADFGVISDVDDTIVRSDVARTALMAGRVLFGNAHTRSPFPGVAPFFRALHRGAAGDTSRPVFYVSSSPWNLYDVLLHVLELRQIPIGPLELRDWGSLRQELRRDRHREHKLQAIRRIFQMFPSLPFILIGDSGQQDPETYLDLIHEFPDRVLSVYIRNLKRDPLRAAAIRDLADEVESAGSSLVLADDTLAAARHAVGNGWIAPEALDQITGDSEVDRWRTGAHKRERTAIIDDHA